MIASYWKSRRKSDRAERILLTSKKRSDSQTFRFLLIATGHPLLRVQPRLAVGSRIGFDFGGAALKELQHV